jgi:hypothetical protein
VRNRKPVVTLPSIAPFAGVACFRRCRQPSFRRRRLTSCSGCGSIRRLLLTVAFAAFLHSPPDLPAKFEDRRIEPQGFRLRLGERFDISGATSIGPERPI